MRKSGESICFQFQVFFLWASTIFLLCIRDCKKILNIFFHSLEANCFFFDQPWMQCCCLSLHFVASTNNQWEWGENESRERVRVCVWERKREIKKESECWYVCVCTLPYLRVCVCLVCLCVCVCVSVCVCVRERERKREIGLELQTSKGHEISSI